MTNTRTSRRNPLALALALAFVLAAASTVAFAQAASPAPTPTPAASPDRPHPAKPSAPASPTAPVVDASELDTLRIDNALKDFQLNQATLTDAQNKTEPLRQAIIHSIATAAGELHLTPDYQWDFQQKKFIKPQPAPAAPAPAPAPAPAAAKK
jgi:hypothetical protein